MEHRVDSHGEAFVGSTAYDNLFLITVPFIPTLITSTSLYLYSDIVHQRFLHTLLFFSAVLRALRQFQFICCCLNLASVSMVRPFVRFNADIKSCHLYFIINGEIKQANRRSETYMQISLDTFAYSYLSDRTNDRPTDRRKS